MKRILALLLSALCVSFTMLPWSGSALSDDDMHELVHSHFYYRTFEEKIGSATDIIKAKCIGVTYHKVEHHYDYEFEVLERFCGEDTEGTILVSQHEDTYYTAIDSSGPCSYHSRDITYDIGEEYLLILLRWRQVYWEHDEYHVVTGNVFLPIKNLEKSSMYGDPLFAHSNFSEAKEYDTEAKLVSYLLYEMSKTPAGERLLFEGHDHILSNDIGTIISKSPIILKIKVGDQKRADRHDRCSYMCTITDVLKGPVESDWVAEIFFVGNDIHPNEEYIIAANGSSNLTWFVPSSKNSLFGLSDEKMIRNFIKESENSPSVIEPEPKPTPEPPHTPAWVLPTAICGGAVLLAAAVAVPTVILRRKKRIMAADGDTAEAEGV